MLKTNMAAGKSWMNYYSMTTMRIGYEVKSQKSGIMYKWATQHDTGTTQTYMTTCMIA